MVLNQLYNSWFLWRHSSVFPPVLFLEFLSNFQVIINSLKWFFWCNMIMENSETSNQQKDECYKQENSLLNHNCNLWFWNVLQCSKVKIMYSRDLPYKRIIHMSNTLGFADVEFENKRILSSVTRHDARNGQ